MRRGAPIALALSLFIGAAPAETSETRSAEGLKILERADAACRAIQAASYRITATPAGAAENFASAGEGRALVAGWGPGGPQKFHFHVKTSRQGSDEPVELTGGGDGESYFLIDHSTKKGYEDMDPGVLGSGRQALGGVLFLEFVHPEPFSDELNAERVELLDPETVGGEECDRVHVVYAGGMGESTWLFSRRDHLPRRRVRHLDTPQGKGTLTLEVTELKIAPEIAPTLFRMELPEGYEQIDDFAP